MERTTPAEMHESAVDALLDALVSLGLDAHRSEAANAAADLVLQGSRGPIPLVVKAFSVADLGRLRDWRSRRRARTADSPAQFVVVADLVPATTAAWLSEQGIGYLDRRGQLHLVTDGVHLRDTTLDSLERVRPAPMSPIAGRVGLGVALCLLMDPSGEHGVRELARHTGAAASTVHAAVQRLREHALMDARMRPLVPELFEVVASEWRPHRVPVAREPDPNDNRTLQAVDEDQGGWLISGDVAAAAWGAPVVVGSGAPPDFYVPSPTVLRRAVRRLGEAGLEDRGATLAVAPTPVATAQHWMPETLSTPWPRWPLAHPVVVALDLAQDRSRGREILEDWTPEGVSRVW